MPFPEQVLYAMAYGNFCPGPEPRLEAEASQARAKAMRRSSTPSRRNYMNFPTMGAWVVVEHRPDDIVVKRRNPYYWKVDETGQQLPYLDEMHFRLSTWVTATCSRGGTGDFSNLEQPKTMSKA